MPPSSPPPIVHSSPFRTFAQALLGAPILPHAVIPDKPLELYFGEPAVTFTEEDERRLLRPLSLALIRKFSHKRPPVDVVRKAFSAFGFVCVVHIGFVDQKHISILPQKEEDFLRLRSRLTWFVANAPMRVFRWSVNFDPLEESSIASGWVSFPSLRYHLFDESALFLMAKSFGNPLKIDKASSEFSRPSVARVFVEVDLSRPLPARVRVNLPGTRSYWQDCEFEDFPKFCKLCRHLGHFDLACKVVPQDQPATKEYGGQVLPDHTGVLAPGLGSSQAVSLQQTVTVSSALSLEHTLPCLTPPLHVGSISVVPQEAGQFPPSSLLSVEAGVVSPYHVVCGVDGSGLDALASVVEGPIFVSPAATKVTSTGSGSQVGDVSTGFGPVQPLRSCIVGIQDAFPSMGVPSPKGSEKASEASTSAPLVPCVVLQPVPVAKGPGAPDVAIGDPSGALKAEEDGSQPEARATIGFSVDVVQSPAEGFGQEENMVGRCFSGSSPVRRQDGDLLSGLDNSSLGVVDELSCSSHLRLTPGVMLPVVREKTRADHDVAPLIAVLGDGIYHQAPGVVLEIGEEQRSLHLDFNACTEVRQKGPEVQGEDIRKHRRSKNPNRAIPQQIMNVSKS
ncbi:Uncharacterized protein M6B38_248850 [Iris pallida]|uniref:DUF4283 domain-containing protein n=1 Tax=Iris pallida TaxID=29817 RepID=A0AAX6DFJ1_IRIPA|nr:Uncharacterized protein M6B38_248850 [Iris pallida]